MYNLPNCRYYAPAVKPKQRTSLLKKNSLMTKKSWLNDNMLVDLGRNDLGKIAKFGSVKVEALHMLQRFSHVIHITSTVSGDIQDGKDALDAIGATLPAGTLSGGS